MLGTKVKGGTFQMEKRESNAINPKHYNRLDPEPKDVIRKWGLNFNMGNAVKYVARAGYKDDIVQDLKKAQEYLQFEIDAIEAERAGEDYCNGDCEHCDNYEAEDNDNIPSFEDFLKGAGMLPPDGVEIYAIEVPEGTAPEEVIKAFIEKVYTEG